MDSIDPSDMYIMDIYIYRYKYIRNELRTCRIHIIDGRADVSNSEEARDAMHTDANTETCMLFDAESNQTTRVIRPGTCSARSVERARW